MLSLLLFYVGSFIKFIPYPTQQITLLSNAIRVVKSISPQEERSMWPSKAVLPTDTLPFAVP
jgi:hypothetical protein